MQYPESIKYFFQCVMLAHCNFLMETQVKEPFTSVEEAVKNHPEVMLDVGYLQLEGGLLTYFDLYAASKGENTERMEEYLLQMFNGIKRYGHSLDKQFDYMVSPTYKEDGSQVYLTGHMLVEFNEFIEQGKQIHEYNPEA